MAEGDKKFDTKLPMQNININAATKFARGFQLSISPRQCGGGGIRDGPGRGRRGRGVSGDAERGVPPDGVPGRPAGRRRLGREPPGQGPGGACGAVGAVSWCWQPTPPPSATTPGPLQRSAHTPAILLFVVLTPNPLESVSANAYPTSPPLFFSLHPRLPSDPPPPPGAGTGSMSSSRQCTTLRSPPGGLVAPRTGAMDQRWIFRTGGRGGCPDRRGPRAQTAAGVRQGWRGLFHHTFILLHGC